MSILVLFTVSFSAVTIVDLIAASTNAFNGALLARKPDHYRNYTVVGIILLAMIGGIGGGVACDVLLNKIPSAFVNPWYVILCVFKQDEFTSTWSPVNMPHLHNLEWDPREEHEVGFPHVWVAPPMAAAASAFLHSLTLEPPIKPGTPDPYVPPKPGELRAEEHIELGAITQFVTTLVRTKKELQPHPEFDIQRG